MKVNMGCSGTRDPADRLTTHPLVAEAILFALLDCGAKVSFGDDVARSGKHCEAIHRSTGMWDVARRTGARLIDFVSCGAREVRGRLFYPRKHLVTNAYFETDVVVNAANFRSHVGIGVSGAIKNMFGCVIGLRKQAIHNMFPGDSRRFARALADIHCAIPADVSFLDATSVVAGAGIRYETSPVGLLLASTDPVALDTVAAHAAGYEDLPIWTSYYAERFGLGSCDLERIDIRGVDWNAFEKQRLKYPAMASDARVSVYDRATALLNNTVFRPRPVISEARCTGCGDCAERCPVQCIQLGESGTYRVDLKQCVDCGCCVRVCEVAAVAFQFVGVAGGLRKLTGKLLPGMADMMVLTSLDPAAKSTRPCSSDIA
jgi:uncharacterized protein (DUF362 family)/NAD-dependent dihydropyrimidine dehydrogenase PreA subunit